MSPDDVREAVERAADTVAPVWPLHSFVAANPLAGLADRPFHEAVAGGERLFGGEGYPSADVFRRAWESGRVDADRLRAELDAAGSDADPEALLARMAATERSEPDDTGEAAARLDRLTTKWLAAFLDEGQATWPMPDREAGFYRAVRAVARHDGEIPDGAFADLPDDPVDALSALLADHPRDRWTAIAEHHLTALPGWTGLIRRRAGADGDWQSAYPITLSGYLAVRLALAEALDAPVAPPAEARADGADRPLREAWLRAWEASYREELVDAVADASESLPADDGRPDAQLAFCIDTRSEILRRHVEAAGAYETHGYAGFFGVPMRYEGYGADAAVDSHPPILDTRHRIADRPSGDHDHDDRRAAHDRVTGVADAGAALFETLKTNAATAFGFVESAGSGYGAALAARTLVPARVRDALAALDGRTPDAHEFCAPTVAHDPDADGDLPLGTTHEERVEYAATAFELTGWTEFARVVAFVGHASETSNNPFAASLDCGACAGNPGGPNARVLASICNDGAVRASLRERGIEIPDDTVFVAGEHNTTTDEVELYADDVPPSHEADIARLRADLAAAREGAAAERAADLGAAADARETERRAAYWAETRPEWGLAGNAAFVVGPRALTDDLDLDGRAFLHSYDPRTDDDGSALDAIVGGPMLVAQWINAQYYFATVDTAVYGSGSKVTQNPVGNVGVYQGPGGDLLTGLPRQSVAAPDGTPYHQPLRLSTVIYAPVDRVTGALAANETVRGLLDGGWLSLTVVEPAGGVHRYDGDLSWTPVREVRAEAQEPTPVVADD